MDNIAVVKSLVERILLAEDLEPVLHLLAEDVVFKVAVPGAMPICFEDLTAFLRDGRPLLELGSRLEPTLRPTVYRSLGARAAALIPSMTGATSPRRHEGHVELRDG